MLPASPGTSGGGMESFDFACGLVAQTTQVSELVKPYAQILHFIACTLHLRGIEKPQPGTHAPSCFSPFPFL